MKKILVLMAIVLMAGAATAMADIVNIRPIVAAGGSPGEESLQDVFASIGSSIQVNATPSLASDQSDAAIFTNMGGGASVATMVIELAGNAGSNTFGIYQFGNPADMVQVFSGGASQSAQSVISFYADGSVAINFGTPIANFGNEFGFYLSGPGGTFYTEDSLNGGPQALIFAGQGDTVQVPGLAAGSDAGHYYVAFEDLPYDANTSDFQDMVVMVESVQPVPEPGSMLLLGTGLFGLAGAIRRRAKK